MRIKFTIILIFVLALSGCSGKKVEIKKGSMEQKNIPLEKRADLEKDEEAALDKNFEINKENEEKKDFSEIKNKVDSNIPLEKDSGPIPTLNIKNKYVSWGFSSADSRKIDTIVIHSSYDAIGDEPYSLEGLLKEYKEYGVSPHYLIDRKGIVYLLVKEQNIAYHAGESSVQDGRKNVNNFSIGIELMNTKNDKLTESQYNSLKKLIAYIKKNHSIKYVLGHNQVSPGRKDDPWNFVWSKIR